MPSPTRNKKQTKKPQDTKKSKKQKLTFQQRFKDKKNVVGKAGLIEILDMHQPFSLDPPKTNLVSNRSSLVQTHSPSYNKKLHLNSRGNRTEVGKPRFQDKAVTPPYSVRKREQYSSLDVKLPKINRSTPNLKINDHHLNRAVNSSETENYWDSISKLNKSKILSKRGSQLSALNLVRINYDANAHWDIMTKFNRICQVKKNRDKKNEREPNFITKNNNKNSDKLKNANPHKIDSINPQFSSLKQLGLEQRRMSLPNP